MTPVGTVVWQGIPEALQVRSRADLLQAIEQARKAAKRQGVPVAVELRVYSSGVMSILVGADRSYLVYKPNNGRFCHALNEGADDLKIANHKPGKCMAFIEDGHLSEIDLKYTIPFEQAQEVLLDFAETGEIPGSLRWMSA